MFIHDAIEYNQNQARQKSPNISSGFIMEEEMLSSEDKNHRPVGLAPKRRPSGDATSQMVKTFDVSVFRERGCRCSTSWSRTKWTTR